ncbi:FkbM family methyltransferase, partial [bacterium]|nr:FkbM family methyltransferase [bacterium]
ILIDGFYEYKELITLIEWLKKKIKFNNVLDIGAYIGNHSVFFSKYFKNVLSFEPNPHSFNLLKLNTKKYKNINIFNFGLSKKNSTQDFYSYELNYGGSSLKKNNKIPYQKFKTKFYKFDQLNKKKKIDLIKIDVEGEELNVLKGLKDTVKKNQPIIIFEVQKDEIKNGSSKVIDYLKDLKYNKFYSIENYESQNINIIDKMMYFLKFVFYSRKKYVVKKDFFEKKFYSFIIAEKCAEDTL